jgi:hypothetical protein
MPKVSSLSPLVKLTDDERLARVLELEAKLAVHERKMARLRAEYRRRIRAARKLTRKQDKELRRAWFPEDFQRIMRAAPVHNSPSTGCSQVVTKKKVIHHRRPAPRARRRSRRSLAVRAGPSDSDGDGGGEPPAALSNTDHPDYGRRWTGQEIPPGAVLVRDSGGGWRLLRYPADVDFPTWGCA